MRIKSTLRINSINILSIMDISRIRQTINSFIKATLLLALVGCIGFACSEGVLNSDQTDGDSEVSPGKAKMNVHLTDAPADLKEVNINVQGLRIHYTPASDTADTSASDTTGDDEDGNWIDLPVEPMTINLLELQNGVDTLLASAELDPGIYNELRLMLGGDNTVMTADSSIYDLKVPSGQSSGYKIKFKTELEAGEEIDVVVDFDASRSVHKAGRSGKYILKPVLRAFVEDLDRGSITGVLDPADVASSVHAIMDDDTTSTESDTTDGGFLIEGLEAGSYNLVIEPDSSAYSDTTLTGIMVNEGEETDVGTVELSGN